MATASDEGDHDIDAQLAGSVHRILAILTDLRSDVPEPELRARIALVRSLRGELADVEKLLADSRDRWAGAASVSAR